MAWFAVRSFLRTRLVGRARYRDASYRPGLCAVEDRIVLFRAKNGATALRRARAEARAYAKVTKWSNAYGQRIVMESLEYADAYELESKPMDGAEIFSAVEFTAGREARSAMIARKVGTPSGPPFARMFIADDIARELDEVEARVRSEQPANKRMQPTWGCPGPC